MIKILCATPCFGNTVSANYMMSFLDSSSSAIQDDIQIGLLLLGGYSDITGARNLCASLALKDDWDKLLFIDADQVWTYPQLKALLRSERFLAGGAYPLKRSPPELNFLPLKRDEHYFGDGVLTRSEANVTRWLSEEANEEGEVQVRAVPGGFMLISKLVLQKLTETCSYYQDTSRGGEPTQVWNFFEPLIEGETRLTEDYSFCVRAARAGFDCYLQTKAIIRHEGTHIYEFNTGAPA